MVDIFTKKKRSEIMSKIRSKNTLAERAVFRLLKRKGIYFQKHYRLRDRKTFTIDIALPRKKVAVFIDGDFWHGYQFPKLRKRLSKKYWLEKIENNVRRDNRNRAKLKREGWRILRVWEHEIKRHPDTIITRIIEFLTK